MSDRPEVPDLSYAMSSATCCGEGLDGEFYGVASLTWDQWFEKHDNSWGFPDPSARPAHGIGHGLLVNGSSAYPQTNKMRRIIEAPEYQGSGQYEFFVLGIQKTVEEINQEGSKSRNYSKKEIEDKIKNHALDEYNTSYRHYAEFGNKGKYYIAMRSDPPRRVFDVARELKFSNFGSAEAANVLSLKNGDMSWIDKVGDGDSFISDGQRQTYRAIKRPDFEDETWSILLERSATYIEEVQQRIRTAETIEDFNGSSTFGESYQIILTAETADPQNRNMRWEDIIGLDLSTKPSEPAVKGCTQHTASEETEPVI